MRQLFFVLTYMVPMSSQLDFFGVRSECALTMR